MLMQPEQKNRPQILLASTSLYRKELLEKLCVSFTTEKPRFNEDTHKAEWLAAHGPDFDPSELAMELAQKKAESLMTHENCVIGGDQMVTLDLQILGKPKTRERAIEQLQMMQGRTHQLITATYVYFKSQSTKILDITELTMRPLSRAQIETYVDIDQPFDCAGSYKIEKHGLSLFSEIKSEDFSGIQGLPLLKLSKVLLSFGYEIPGPAQESPPA